MSLENLRATVTGLADAVSANIDDAIKTERQALTAIREAIAKVRADVVAVDEGLAALDAILSEKSAGLIGEAQGEAMKQAAE